MKMVMAVIRPERLQCVKDALRDIGINGMTISHVTGRGEQMGLTFTTRVGEFVVDEIEKVKIESVVDDGDVERVIETIRRSAETGNPGDGEVDKDQDGRRLNRSTLTKPLTVALYFPPATGNPHQKHRN